MDSGICLVSVVVLVAALALYLEYLIRRWSWIPRKKHNRVFNERF